MRFIGSKDLIVEDIHKLLSEKKLDNKGLVLFDAFCGTGSVSDYLKNDFNIVINDLLTWSTLYTRGRIYAKFCEFNRLGFNPFDFLNSNENIIKGFFYNNYSKGNSNRMYFSTENAGRIDYFRKTIEDWKNDNLLTENEYCFLLASLVESVSMVSNTAGVYGAFLKHWDSRAKKKIKLIKIESVNSDARDISFFNNKLEDIISEVDCDILYLDPPYTQNQYGTQYHLLETLVLNDMPEISKITGSRPTAPMRSDWSKEYKAHILLDKILAKTRAKYIVLSYSQDGIISKSFIEAILKRYGKPNTYKCKKIPHKRYMNFKNKSKKEHFEYLFFIEREKEKDVFYESPLNYTGNKFKLIQNIKQYIPNNINKFNDVFGGGFNVGINIDSNEIIYNEINYFVKNLICSFKEMDTHQYILFINRIIKKFGLEKANTKNYLILREYYNNLQLEKKDIRILYALILYGYNQQIRFNNNLEFNNPVGMRWFNDKLLEKFISYSRVIKEKNIQFTNTQYHADFDKLRKIDFVYLDPPYMLTTGAYNDGKRGFEGWNKEKESEMFEFLDKLTANHKRFMLSYVLKHKGKFNSELYFWVKKRGYKIIELKTKTTLQREEIIIINYEYKINTKISYKEQLSEKI